jgi:hypothetical protein
LGFPTSFTYNPSQASNENSEVFFCEWGHLDISKANPRFEGEELFINQYIFFSSSQTEHLTLEEINFQARHLLKQTKQKNLRFIAFSKPSSSKKLYHRHIGEWQSHSPADVVQPLSKLLYVENFNHNTHSIHRCIEKNR